MRKLFSVKTLSLIVFAILIMFVITCFVLTIRPLKSVHAETAIERSADSGETETGETGETTPSGTDETTPPDSSNTDKTLEEENKELKLKLEELIAEFNASSASEYFNKNILPLLTGSCSAIVAGLASLLPYIRNKNKRKQLEAYAATLQKANADLETLLKSTDPEAVKTAVDSLFGDRATEIANKMLEKMNVDMKRVNELATEIGTVNAKLDCLIKGAQNAWAKSSAATAALSAAPEKSLLVAKEAENAQLKQYIRSQKGEDAEKLICDICYGKITV